MSIPDNTVRSFFLNDLHNFPKTDQSEWAEFAASTSYYIKDIFEASEATIVLMDVLQLMSLERAKFAATQADLSDDKKEEFGQWRANVYSLSSQDISTMMKRRLMLNKLLKKADKPLLDFDLVTSISHTFYPKERILFNSVINNLDQCEKEDSAHLSIIPTVDTFTKQCIDQIVGDKVNISPPSFYDISEYKKYTVIDSDNSSTPLTSFFVLSKPSPTFFIVLEHPQPHIVFSLLNSTVNDLFVSLLACKDDRDLFIKKLSEFLWYGHHLMPFERGSASIFLILNCALQQYAKIPLKRYPDNRLDIDAISLTKKVFMHKFIGLFD